VTNVADAEGRDSDGDRVNDTDDAAVDVTCIPGLAIEKQVSGDNSTWTEHITVVSGSTVYWKITVVNTGGTLLVDVNITDTNGQSFGPITLLPGSNATSYYTTIPTVDALNIACALAKVGNQSSPCGDVVGPVYDNASVDVVTPAKLTISKTDNPDPVRPNDQLTYTVSISNTGGSPALNVVMREQYDPNFIFVSAAPAPDAGTNNKWSLGTIDVGQTRTITIIGLVADNGEDSLLNVATYTSSNAGNGRDTEPTDVVYPAIGLQKDVSKSVAEPGDELVYTITYYNPSDVPLTNVVVRDVYPSGITFLSAIPAPDSGTIDMWTIGTLAPHTSGTIRITARVEPVRSAGFVLINYANITCDEGLTDNDTARTVIEADPVLSIAKSDSPDPVEGGKTLTYVIVFSNVGNLDATNVIVTDVYNETLLTITDADGGTVSGDTIAWHIPSLAVGQSLSFTVQAFVKVVDVQTVIWNYVNITCQEGAYDEDTEPTTIIPPPSMGFPFLQIVKYDLVDPVCLNHQIEYEIVVSNLGDGDATNVTVQDVLGSDLVFFNAQPYPTLINGNLLTWHVGTLTPGASFTIYLVAEAQSVGVKLNTATATSDEGLYTEDNETTTVAIDEMPPSTWKVCHGQVDNIWMWGKYLIHYIPKTTNITLKSVDYQGDCTSGVERTYYRIWWLNATTGHWEMVFNWKLYNNKKIHLYSLRGYGKYEIEFYSIDRYGNQETVQWNDVYVYRDPSEIPA
jgi:uncharacterized repeat protein (TIGR01451 family)